MSDVQPDQTTTPAPQTDGPTTGYTGLTVTARRDADQGRWVFGVEMGGAFIPLADAKLGHVDDELQEAATPGFKLSRRERYEHEVLGH